MSGSEVLEEIVSKKGGKIWVCRKVGRRISYIDGLKAGEEQYVPPTVIYENGDFVVFAENVVPDPWVVEKLKELIESLKEGEL